MAVSDSTAQKYERLDPDVRLMLQVRDHDNAAAFEELVLRYQARLITVLEQIVRSRDLAEDLAQEVFLRVYRSRKNYEAGAKFATWLFTIANNIASNALRSSYRKHEWQAPASPNDSQGVGLDQLAVAASGQTPSRLLDKVERAQIVREAIQTLNERQRMALMLSKYEGMSYHEIGDTMGLSLEAVKSLLMRARVNLKSLLKPYMEQGTRPTSSPTAAEESSS